MARITQITDKSQLPPEHHALADRIVQARGGLRGPYSILLHDPAITDKVDALAGALRSDSELSGQDFVLTALSVARAKDCLFVWSVQAPNARKAGVSDQAIEAIRDRKTSGLSEDQADLVSYVQQLAGGARVDQSTFDRLKERHSVRWLVDLTVATGHFGLISGINNAFEVPPSAEGDKLPV